MFINHLKENSGALMFRTALVLLLSLFVVGLVPGLLNIGTSQAQAHDGRDDWGHHRWHHKPDACAQTTNAALTACQFAVQEDYNLALGNCANVAKSEQDDCKAEAKGEFESALEECTGQFDARQEVCGELGGGPYDPVIDPDNFVSKPKLLTGNEYFPLTRGSKYTYQSKDSEGNIQTIVVKVKGTTTINGVLCRIVTDKVYDGEGTDGDLVEDTIDWFAQDNDGNIWYFGETTIAYTYDDYGNPIASTEGSWMAGMDQAKPGIIMYAVPEDHLNELYRQEFLLGTAEDLGKVIGTVDTLVGLLPADVSLPDGVAGPYLHTQDSTPLDVPAVIEDKYYAPGVGLVLTVEPEAKEVLTEIEPPSAPHSAVESGRRS
jgi:hypothetical protein